MLDRDGFPVVKRTRRREGSVAADDSRSTSERSEGASSWRSMISRPTRESMAGGHIIPVFEDAVKQGVTYFRGSVGRTAVIDSETKDEPFGENLSADLAKPEVKTENASVADDDDDDQFVDALAAEIERKTTQDMERSWYEHEEGFAVERDGSKSGVSTRREKRMISYLKSVGKSLFQADQERWEKNRLSSVGFGFAGTAEGECINQDDYRDYRNIISVTPNVIPPFLEHDRDYLTLNPGQFQKQRDIPLVADPNCDMAQLAKNGSPSLKLLKEQAEKSRDRFWQLAGTAMGHVIGLRDEEARAEELRAAEELEKAEPLSRLGRSMLAAGHSQSREEIERTKARLPITGCRKELVSLIRENSVVVVVGETGSGKTTQLTQILLEEGIAGELISRRQSVIPPGAFTSAALSSSDSSSDEEAGGQTASRGFHPYNRYQYSMIGCTQPRRVAAVSVAKRVADEMGVDLGKEVGYAIRFEDCTSESTKIKYMTDAYLLRETLTDPLLERYDVIIMDEAHERSLATDVLLGLLKQLVSSSERCGGLKLIITSATMNSKLFSEFFGGCPIYNIPGRTFPVTINYLKSVPKDYVDQAIYQCLKIHTQNPFRADEPSDILIFMTGQEDIEATAFLLIQKVKTLLEAEEEEALEAEEIGSLARPRGPGIQPLCVLPIYSTLPADLQSRVFEKTSVRKVIIATNIAETSLTLDGVRFVIDCGLCKLKVYSPQLGMDTLQLTPISRANAQQRSGRAGRTAPGMCYRLYSEQAFYTQMNEAQLPEIQRSNLSHVVLLLRSIVPSNSDAKAQAAPLVSFPFLSPPALESIRQAEIQLWMLGALDDDGALTRIGKRMSGLPVDPCLARMILTAETFGCVEDIITIVACLSVPSVFYHPRGGTAGEAGGMSSQQDAADSAHEKFFVPESDHLTLMNVYNQWIVHRCSPCWSKKNFLQQRALLKVKSVRDQLTELINKPNLINANRRQKQKVAADPISDAQVPGSREVALRKCIASGYFHHAGKLKSLGQYVNLQTSFPCHLHPNSALILSGSVPQYVVYHEVLLTTKEYMHTVTAIEPDWLAELAPTLYSIKKAGYS